MASRPPRSPRFRSTRIALSGGFALGALVGLIVGEYTTAFGLVIATVIAVPSDWLPGRPAARNDTFSDSGDVGGL